MVITQQLQGELSYLCCILKVTLVRLLQWCQNEYICYWVRVNEDGTQQNNQKCNFHPKIEHFLKENPFETTSLQPKGS